MSRCENWRAQQAAPSALVFGLYESVFFAFFEERLALMPRISAALADFVARGFERGANGVALEVFEGTQARRTLRPPCAA